MSINILGGNYKGFSLVVSKHLTIRPTSVMLRRKLFDSHQNLEGFVFVDICAGSGAMGIEALSRGANEIYLNEKDPKVVKNLQDNLKNLNDKYQTSESVHSSKGDGLSFLQKFLDKYENFDDEQKVNTILFFDPPYELVDLYEKFFDTMTQNKQFQGQIWVEADRQKTFPSAIMENKLEYMHKTYTQGTSYICIFKR